MASCLICGLFREIFHDQDSGWFFGLAFLKGVWNLPLRRVVRAESKVNILIAVKVRGVQCNLIARGRLQAMCGRKNCRASVSSCASSCSAR